MKNTIFIVSFLSVVIVLVVLLMSYARENDLDFSDTGDDYYRPAENLLPDLELYVVTSEANFWDRVAGLKATEAPEYLPVTDEEGNAVTDEEGNIVTEIPLSPEEASENDEIPAEGAELPEGEAPVTEIPDGRK